MKVSKCPGGAWCDSRIQRQGCSIRSYMGWLQENEPHTACKSSGAALSFHFTLTNWKPTIPYTIQKSGTVFTVCVCKSLNVGYLAASVLIYQLACCSCCWFFFRICSSQRVESDLCNSRSPAWSCQLWKPKTIQSLAPWTGASQFLPSHKKIFTQHSTAQRIN